MYKQISSVGKNLFDTSVGHANDMFKWYKSGILSVYGIDIDPEQISLAKKRYTETKHNLQGSNYKFEIGNMLTYDIRNHVNKYNIVVSNFTLHYFFEPGITNYPNVDKFVEKVASLLKIGGVFAGTTLVGDNIIKLIASNKSDNEYYTLKWVDKSKNKYSYQLKDISTKDVLYTQDKASIEYLVHFEYLKKVCEKNNLLFINSIEFRNIYNQKQCFKDYERNISFLNNTFIFQKRS